jgi:guanylate kinase
MVHGHRYGTLKSAIEGPMAEGRSVLLDIDVAGAAQVREIVRGLPPDAPLKRAFLDVFIDVPSLEELRRRLVTRGEDSPETIEKRMKNASGEIARANEYRFRIVNDDLEIAYKELKAVVEYVNGVIGPENTEEPTPTKPDAPSSSDR